jgi:hypothetical protein
MQNVQNKNASPSIPPVSSTSTGNVGKNVAASTFSIKDAMKDAAAQATTVQRPAAVPAPVPVSANGDSANLAANPTDTTNNVAATEKPAPTPIPTSDNNGNSDNKSADNNNNGGSKLSPAATKFQRLAQQNPSLLRLQDMLGLECTY